MSKELALAIAAGLLKAAGQIIDAFNLSDDELKQHVEDGLAAKSELAADLARYEASKDLRDLID